jgi:hypothetical protein
MEEQSQQQNKTNPKDAGGGFSDEFFGRYISFADPA